MTQLAEESRLKPHGAILAKACQRMATEMKRLIDWPDEIVDKLVGKLEPPSPYECGLHAALGVAYGYQREHLAALKQTYHQQDDENKALTDVYCEALRRLNGASKRAIGAAHQHTTLAPTAFCEAKRLPR